MEEKETEKIPISAKTIKQHANEDNINVNYKILWNDMRNWKSYFNTNDLASAIILELLPSVYDIGSDFALAKDWETSIDSKLGIFATFTYFLLSLPGLVMAAKGLYNRIIRKCLCCAWTERCMCKFTGFLILLGLGGGAMVGVILLCRSQTSWPFFTTAIMSSSFILLVKLMRILVHSPEMKKLSVKASAAESQNESALQLYLILFLIVRGKIAVPGVTTLMSLTSSFVMIGKTGAENLLTFGSINKLEGKGFWEKWKMMLKLVPVLTMTCIFRVLTFAIWSYVLLMVDLALQILVLLLLKLILPTFSSLTPLDLVQGVAAEISTPSIWGTLGREKSRNVQLGLVIYYLVVNTGLLIPNIVGFSVVMGISGDLNFSLEYNVINATYLQPLAVAALLCGWIAFPLYMYQIFWMESFNWMDKMEVLTQI